MWYSKYRPQSLNQYVFKSEEERKRIEKWIKDPLKYANLLFYGPTGTGKTSLALLIQKHLDLGNDALFLPASIYSGVEDIKNKIISFCEVGEYPKLVILDEADRLSQASQESLRNVFDLYEKSVRFIFTCNNSSKIIDPLKSRMLDIAIDKLDKDDFIQKLLDILKEEGLDIDWKEAQASFDAIVTMSYPNLRMAINTLQNSIHKNHPDDKCYHFFLSDNDDFEWKEELLNLFKKNRFSNKSARELICSIKQDRYINVYKCLYQNSEIFNMNEGEAVIIIAEYLHKDKNCDFREINLVACLIKLNNLLSD